MSVWLGFGSTLFLSDWKLTFRSAVIVATGSWGLILF